MGIIAGFGNQIAVTARLTYNDAEILTGRILF
jgi:hypothetical protein